MKKPITIGMIAVIPILAFLLIIIPYSVYGQGDSEEETVPSWGAVIGIIAAIITTAVIAPRIKKRNTNKLLKQKELFRRSSFFVQKIRWTGSNITFAVLFDNERILFVHSHKISKAPKESSVEEILEMSKHNFQIPINEISLIEVAENTEGSNGARTGVLIVDSKEYKGEFDINAGQDFQECQAIVNNFCPKRDTLSKD